MMIIVQSGQIKMKQQLLLTIIVISLVLAGCDTPVGKAKFVAKQAAGEALADAMLDGSEVVVFKYKGQLIDSEEGLYFPTNLGPGDSMEVEFELEEKLGVYYHKNYMTLVPKKPNPSSRADFQIMNGKFERPWYSQVMRGKEGLYNADGTPMMERGRKGTGNWVQSGSGEMKVRKGSNAVVIFFNNVVTENNRRKGVFPKADGAKAMAAAGFNVRYCGDGVNDPEEDCDDGNTDDGDNCPANCQIGIEVGVGGPSNCGDGTYQSEYEGCDDGDFEPGDGCDKDCNVETGWTCTTDEPSRCKPVCGDGVILGDEGCDDGNGESNDGCSSSCKVEIGWSCDGAPSTCQTQCGDGIVAGDEQCDGSNLDGKDCQSLSYGGGTLECSALCTFDTVPVNQIGGCCNAESGSWTNVGGCDGTCGTGSQSQRCDNPNPDNPCGAKCDSYNEGDTRSVKCDTGVACLNSNCDTCSSDNQCSSGRCVGYFTGSGLCVDDYSGARFPLKSIGSDGDYYKYSTPRISYVTTVGVKCEDQVGRNTCPSGAKVIFKHGGGTTEYTPECPMYGTFTVSISESVDEIWFHSCMTWDFFARGHFTDYAC
jgi:cysteine-rich repeat protein